MEAFLLASFLMVGLSSKSFAQITPPPAPTAAVQSYYTSEKEKEVVGQLQTKILAGCTTPLQQQPAYPNDELQFDVEQVKTVLQNKFSKSFDENPKLKEKLDKSLEAIMTDKSCAAAGNDCRTRLVATATYYLQMLRPNMPGCNGYVKYDYNTPAARKKRAEDNGYIKECETELSLRNTVLSGYGRSNGGMDQRGAYTDALTNELNNALIQIQQGILTKTTDKKIRRGKIVEVSKSREEISICGDVDYGTVYSYPLRTNLYKDPFGGYDPDKTAPQTPTSTKPKEDPKTTPCVEEVKVLHEEFVPMNFAEGSSTVGNDQVKPVKQKIEAFVNSNSSLVITDIQVTSSSSKTPYMKSVGGKRVYEKEYSDKKNLELADKRAGFAKSALESIINAHPELKNANYSASGAINGPDYSAEDAATRNMTSKDSDYKAKVEALYQANQEMLNKEAMIKSSSELMDSERFTSLYDVKYKPYQGFKIVIKGYSKDSRKCPDGTSSTPTSTTSPQSGGGSQSPTPSKGVGTQN